MLTLVNKEEEFPFGDSVEEAASKWGRSKKTHSLDALSVFARHGNIDQVKEALRQNPSERQMYAAVVGATAYGHFHIVRLLIGRGAEVSLRWNDGDNECEPIVIACIHNRYDLAELLLKAGANAKAAFCHLRPIHCAIAHGNLKLVQLLGAHGGFVGDAVNLVDLSMICGQGHLIEYLRSRGESVVTVETEWGHKPLRSKVLIRPTRFEHIMKSLEQYILQLDFEDIKYYGEKMSLLQSEYEAEFGES